MYPDKAPRNATIAPAQRLTFQVANLLIVSPKNSDQLVMVSELARSSRYFCLPLKPGPLHVHVSAKWWHSYAAWPVAPALAAEIWSFFASGELLSDGRGKLWSNLRRGGDGFR